MGIFGVSSYMVNTHGTSITHSATGERVVAITAGLVSMSFAVGIWRRDSLPWQAVYPGLGLAWILIASVGIRMLALKYSGTPFHQRVIWIGVLVLAAVPLLVHVIRRSYEKTPGNFET
jgi:hypothetical protein